MNTTTEIGAGLGAALQFLRSRSKFPEWAYALIVGLGAVAIVWGTGTDLGAFVGPERTAAWSKVVQTVIGALAGTQGVSSAANVAVSAGANSAHPLMPVTNSK